MKIYMMEQGSDAWRQVRLGRPTSSNAHRIVTKAKCDLSAQAADYGLRLVAERLLNASSESSIESPWMERGRALEPLAARQYDFTQEVETIPVGFITTDDGRIGCSPDRLVVSDRRIAVEIKCTSPHVHLGYLLNGLGDAYRPQVQMQIMVAELERADLYAFHDQCPPVLIQTAPDKDYISKLSAALYQFCDTLDHMHQRALSLGAFQPAARRGASQTELCEIANINDEFRRENERRFVKEGFTI